MIVYFQVTACVGDDGVVFARQRLLGTEWVEQFTQRGSALSGWSSLPRGGRALSGWSSLPDRGVGH